MALVKTLVTKLKIGDRTVRGTVDAIVKRTPKSITIRYQIGKSRDWMPEYQSLKTSKIGVYVKDAE